MYKRHLLLGVSATCLLLAACNQSGDGQVQSHIQANTSASDSARAQASVPEEKVANVDGVRITNADATPGDWLTTGRTYGEQRFSPLRKINDKNVDKLGLAWSYKIDIDRGTEATPLVVDGVMYTTGPFSIVYALNAKTGELLWKYDPKVNKAVGGKGCCGVVNRGVAVWKGKIFVGVYDGRLVALDAKSGDVEWEINTLIDKSLNYTITGAPRVVNDKVLIGNGGAELGVRGYITAFDAATGKKAWRFFTVPGDPSKPVENPILEMAQETWSGDSYWKQGGGGTVWDSMAFDPELNLLYIGVGNGSPWSIYKRSEGKGDNLFLSSIVALDVDTGEYVWHYQTTPGDTWDYTATQHIILADMELDGQPRKVLMQAPKNGYFYVIDRKTGKLLSAENFVPINWSSGIDITSGKPIKTGDADYGEEPKLVMPSPFGAHNWQPMSYNPNTGLVYIPAQHSVFLYENQEGDPELALNAWNTGLKAIKMPTSKKDLNDLSDAYTGELIAWDPVKQKKAWSVEYPTIWNGGTLSTAGNLVFQGTAGGEVRAYTADSGKLLWQSPANTGVIAAPMTYEVDGEQYVTFMVGWGGAFPLAGGPLSAGKLKVQPESRVLTYKIGGKETLPKAVNKPAPIPEAAEVTASAEQLEQGKELFNGYCGTCHGVNVVSGGLVPDLRYLDADTHEQFAAIVKGAAVARGMPSYGHVLDDDQIELIHQYVIQRNHELLESVAAAKK